MTLIALMQTSDGFECYADSLVSFPGATRLDIYCKALVVPVSYRVSTGKKVLRRDHKLGMAISGNLAAATAVYTILSGAAQSLHSHETTKPPKAIDFINLAHQISESVFERIRGIGQNALFGFFLFGHDIATSEPFAVKILTEKSESGNYEVQVLNCALGKGQISLLGSGSNAFRGLIKSEDGNGPVFSELFYRFVTSSSIDTVGGLPQLLIAKKHGDVTIEPVIIGSDDGSDIRMYHSGLELGGYKSVGDFMVGLTMKSFNMEMCNRVQSLKDEGYDPNDPTLSVSQVNQALLQWLLKVHSWSATAVETTGVASVSAPRELQSAKYLCYLCSSCKSICPLFRVVPRMLIKPFLQELRLEVTCKNCEEKFIVSANAFTKNMIEK